MTYTFIGQTEEMGEVANLIARFDARKFHLEPALMEGDADTFNKINEVIDALQGSIDRMRELEEIQ